jgi:hypothetical protein
MQTREIHTLALDREICKLAFLDPLAEQQALSVLVRLGCVFAVWAGAVFPDVIDDPVAFLRVSHGDPEHAMSLLRDVD